MDPATLALLGGTAAAETGGGLLAGLGQKKKNRRTKQRFQGALANVDLAGSTARQDTAEAFGDQQAGLKSNLAERGLTGSTAFDAALNANLGNRQRAMSRINEGVAREKNALLGQYDEQPDASNPLLGLADVLGQGAKLSAVQNQDAVTKAQLNGTETRARLSGGGSWWDRLLNSF